MKNFTQKQYIILAVIIAALIVIIVVRSKSGSVTAPVDSLATSTVMVASSTVPANVPVSTAGPTVTPIVPTATTSLASLPKVIFYSVSVASSSYSQNEIIPIVISIINNSDAAGNFDFKDGCQGSYTIGDYKSIEHVRCTPEATGFRVLPHTRATINLTHYPSVYKLPIGKFTLTGSVVGYSSAQVPITITP